MQLCMHSGVFKALTAAVLSAAGAAAAAVLISVILLTPRLHASAPATGLYFRPVGGTVVLASNALCCVPRYLRLFEKWYIISADKSCGCSLMA